MRRSELLALTGLTLPKFKILAARDQLPFADHFEAEQVAGDAAGLADTRSRYSAQDAVQWHLVEALTANEGLTIGRAASIVRNCTGEIATALAASEAAAHSRTAPIFAGIAHYKRPDDATVSAGHVVGDFAEISRRILINTRGGDHCIRLFLADLGSAVIEVRRRAVDAGIRIPENAGDWSTPATRDKD